MNNLNEYNWKIVLESLESFDHPMAGEPSNLQVLKTTKGSLLKSL